MEAWDCDPHWEPEALGIYDDLDEEQDDTDWQVIVLDRFGDRLVKGN